VYTNNKKKKKRRWPRKTIFFFFAVVTAFAMLLTGIIVILTSGKSLKDTMKDMPFSYDNGHYVMGKNIVYSQGDLLTCVNESFNTVWQLRLFSAGLSFTVNNNLIAAIGQGVIQVVDSDGQHRFSKQIDGDIESARVGKDMVAVYTQQHMEGKTPSYIIVFDLNGDQLFLLDVTSKYVLDYGFDEDCDSLFILELDVSGSVPISRISTYKPMTQSITMKKELKDQLVSNVYWISGKIYAVGTNHLTVYQSLSSEDKQYMTYGWMLEDVYQSDDPKFVYVPSGNAGTFDIARIVRPSGSEIKINLPPGVFQILHEGEKIYCFANTQLFVYTGEGKYLKSYDFPYEISGVERAIGKSVFLKHENMISMMPLP